MEKSSLIETIEEKGLDKIPEFYKSIADTPSLGRLRSIDVGTNVPRVVQIIEESILLDNTGYGERTIKLDGNHKTIPFIEGIVLRPDKSINLIPNYIDSGENTIIEYLGNNTVVIKIRLFGLLDNYANQTISFKLRVWELGTSLGANLSILV